MSHLSIAPVRTRHVLAGALLAAVLALAALVPTATASPTSLPTIGDYTTHLFSGPGCTSPVGICGRGQFRGTFNGPGELVFLAVTPTSTPNLVLISATVVIHDLRGDVFSSEQSTYNPTPGGDGEFAYIGEITGGTRYWAGATGYMQSYGAVPPGSDGGGKYFGKIVRP